MKENYCYAIGTEEKCKDCQNQSCLEKQLADSYELAVKLGVKNPIASIEDVDNFFNE